MNNLEAWSTGLVRVEIEGHEPVFAAVEIMRVSHLVHVIMRADSNDPAFAGVFPMVMTAVEVYPAISMAVDPLDDMGKRIADGFLTGAVERIKAELTRKKSPPS